MKGTRRPTPRSAVDEELRRKNALLERTQAMARVGSWELDAASGVLAWSEETFRIFGVEPGGFSPSYDSFMAMVHPGDRERVARAYSDSLREGAERYMVEHRIIRPSDGEERQLREECVHERDGDGRVLRSIGVVQDLSGWKRLEAESDRERRINQALLDSVPGLVYLYDEEGRLLAWNKAHETVTGYSAEELSRMRLLDWYRGDEETQARILAAIGRVKSEGLGVEEAELQTKDGRRIPFWFSAARLELEGRGYFVGVGIDMTERRAKDRALRESEEKYRSLVENASDIVYSFDASGIFTFVSRNWTVNLGHGLEEVIGHSWREFVHLDDQEALLDHVRRLRETGVRQGGLEYRVRRKDGGTRWHTSNIYPCLDAEGGVAYFAGIARDITERREADERIRQLLAEKEIVLREVHHRIKNNMNTIAALLSMQAEASPSPEVAEALTGAAGRVTSMQVLYDRLYRREDPGSMPVGEYLSELLDRISGSFPAATAIRVELATDDFRLQARELTPLGIIVNEFYTNAAKYAFAGRREGTITVEARRDGRRVRLSFADDGRGFPAGNAEGAGRGFGLRIVEALASQLGGTLTRLEGPGTRWLVEFEA